ncbi:MAG: hypothetical protein RL118_100 [Actinomycetota bacterium]|jgi:hypothetical protein
MSARPTYEFQSIQELFGGVNRYEVPAYQRGYSWGTEQIDQLLGDLRSAYVDEPDRFYILGQVIVCKQGDTFELVDGQQRLTSLFVLIALAKNLIGDTSLAFSAVQRHQFDGLSALLLREDKDEPGELIPTLLAANAGRDHVKAVATGKPLPKEDTNLTQENLRNAVEIYTDWFKLNFPIEEDLFKFLWFVLTKASVLRLTLENVQEALLIFQKMNNRGLALDDADLLKNLLFIRATETEFGRLSNAWDKASGSIFKSRLKRAKNMEFLLKAKIGIRTGNSIPSNKVFEEWEKLLGDASAAWDFALALDSEAQMVANATNNKDREGRGPVTETAGTYLFKWVQHLEILLAGMRLSENSYRLLCDVVDARCMLSMLAGEKNQDFERLIHPWAKKISHLPVDADREQILNASHEALKDGPALIKQMLQEIPKLSYAVSTQRVKLRYCLAIAVQFTEKEAGEIIPVDYVFALTQKVPAGHKTYHLDHIFPKAAAKLANWDSAEKQSLIHSLGNLMLLHPSDNQSKGDALPSDAVTREVALGSKFVMNKVLCPISDDYAISPRVREVHARYRASFDANLQTWGHVQVIKREQQLLGILQQHFEGKLGLPAAKAEQSN